MVYALKQVSDKVHELSEHVLIPRSVCDEGMGQMFHIRHGMGFVLETLVAVQK